MRKVMTIAWREYRSMVATKAFLFSMTLMPLLMFGSIILATRFRDSTDSSVKTIVIVDGTDGALFADLAKAALAHNALVDAAENASTEVVPGAPPLPTVTMNRYKLEKLPEPELTNASRLSLSDDVRHGKILAFVEIPADIDTTASGPGRSSIRYYAQNAMLAPDRNFIDRAVNEAVRSRRLDKLNLDASLVKQATTPVRVVPLGLFKKGSDGTAKGADESQNMVGMLMPFGFMMLMFMVIMLSSQPLLESVMEEKAGRIAEVLLGSAGTFQLMLGKLLGNVAGSLSVITIYGVGAYLVAARNDWLNLLPMHLMPWFVAYQILAVLFFGSLFMAVGASVSQLKEAQTLLLPIWLMLTSPMFVWMQISREPNGTLAKWLSLFPPAAPMTMVSRMASDAVIPIWQPILGLVLMLVCTLICVFLAGRVFRIGILWQGKTPQIGQLVRWAVRG